MNPAGERADLTWLQVRVNIGLAGVRGNPAQDLGAFGPNLSLGRGQRATELKLRVHIPAVAEAGRLIGAVRVMEVVADACLRAVGRASGVGNDLALSNPDIQANVHAGEVEVVARTARVVVDDDRATARPASAAV